ncbi:MAG: hypothetical protein KatS3mg131_0193 [Candidatus Tectimicrobiota bacterium]|nr:MAG: hypothetical protein KatS3mg131_0193 [Candidatus Tectomicrobia bacterium]
MQKGKTRPAWIAVGLFWVIGAALMIGLLSSSYLKQRAVAAHWNPVRATVLSSRVLSYSTDSGPQTYRPEVTYAYTVEGVTYTGRTYSYYKTGSEDYLVVKRKVETLFAPGRHLTVYDNPQRPEEAVIDHTPPDLALRLPVLFLGLFVVGGLPMCGRGLRGWRWRRTAASPAPQ